MDIVTRFYNSFKLNSEKTAFCIKNKHFSYKQLLEYISGSQKLIQEKLKSTGNPIGIICNDCIETYAAIFATWYTGNHFVPINPKLPKSRNNLIIEKTGIKVVISSADITDNIIDTSNIIVLNNNTIFDDSPCNMTPVTPNETMYILSTSGSTGEPKFVPISFNNVLAYCNGFSQIFPDLKPEDNFLQTYDLSSDASLTGFLLPLLIGSTVYTIPSDSLKFLSIAKLMTDVNITWVKLTPSVLTYLTPYISSLNLDHIKQVIFGGEALQHELLLKWKDVFKTAHFSNLYGPTETTISATAYRFENVKNARVREGIISIGKPFPEVECTLVDEHSKSKQFPDKGILCISGAQTMKGYLQQADNLSFISGKDNPGEKKLYITGDIVSKDTDGYYYFHYRCDDEIKIDGYRTNLNEVERSVSKLIPGYNFCIVPHDKIKGITRLFLFIEEFNGDSDKLLSELKQELPGYMVPDKIFSTGKFPYTSGSKIDKVSIKNTFLINGQH